MTEKRYVNYISIIFLLFAYTVINYQLRQSVPQVEVYIIDNKPIKELVTRSDYTSLNSIEQFDPDSVLALGFTSYEQFDDNFVASRPNTFDKLFGQVALVTGVDKYTLYKFAAVESGFKPSARAKSTGASGLFQFTKATWEFATKRYGTKYGISSSTSRLDARANTLMAALSIKSNLQLLKDRTNLKEIGDSHLYVVHLLGRTGSLRFFKSNPDAIIASHMPQAARNNKLFFYNGNKALKQKEIRVVISEHLRNKVREFNVV